MAIELHHLHPGHDDELKRLKERIAELEEERRWRKYSEALAEYIRLNLNISDVPTFPYNRIKVELIAPRMNENNVRIVTAKNRHKHFNDLRRGL